MWQRPSLTVRTVALHLAKGERGRRRSHRRARVEKKVAYSLASAAYYILTNATAAVVGKLPESPPFFARPRQPYVQSATTFIRPDDGLDASSSKVVVGDRWARFTHPFHALFFSLRRKQQLKMPENVFILSMKLVVCNFDQFH